jgi:hypothetical protein
MITFVASDPVFTNAQGWTRGIYPTVLMDQPEFVLRHESIHVVQNLQMMTVSPEWFVKSKRAEDKIKPSLFRFIGLRMNLFSLGFNFLNQELKDNNTDWLEIEAYSLVKDYTTK